MLHARHIALGASLMLGHMTAVPPSQAMPPTVRDGGGTTSQSTTHDTVSVVVSNSCAQIWCPDVGDRLEIHVSGGQEGVSKAPRLSLVNIYKPGSSASTQEAVRPQALVESDNPYRYELKDRQLQPLAQTVQSRQQHRSGWVNETLLAQGTGVESASSVLPGFDRAWDAGSRLAQFERWKGASSEEMVSKADETASNLLPRIKNAVMRIARPIADYIGGFADDDRSSTPRE